MSKIKSCPDESFTGCMTNAEKMQQIVCLVNLSVEDFDYLYLFGTLNTGSLLVRLGSVLLYQGLKEIRSAINGPQKLSDFGF